MALKTYTNVKSHEIENAYNKIKDQDFIKDRILGQLGNLARHSRGTVGAQLLSKDSGVLIFPIGCITYIHNTVPSLLSLKTEHSFHGVCHVFLPDNCW